MRNIYTRWYLVHVAFMQLPDNAGMEAKIRSIATTTRCDHHWQYFVDVASRKMHSRQCEGCGHEERLPLRRSVARVIPLSA
jgi:hypothetical protein